MNKLLLFLILVFKRNFVFTNKNIDFWSIIMLRGQIQNLTNVNATGHILDEIGGLAYFVVYMSEYLPYIMLSSIGIIVGIIGKIIFS